MSWAESMLKHHCKKRVNDLTNALIEGKHITNGTDIVRYDGINMRIKVEGEWWNTDLNIVLILNRPHKWEVCE